MREYPLDKAKHAKYDNHIKFMNGVEGGVKLDDDEFRNIQAYVVGCIYGKNWAISISKEAADA